MKPNARVFVGLIHGKNRGRKFPFTVSLILIRINTYKYEDCLRTLNTLRVWKETFYKLAQHYVNAILKKVFFARD
jgi:hypothetical protein